jgi:hypothetical protein
MKIIKNYEECVNEIKISEKIKQIPYFFLYFSPIKNSKMLNVSDVDENILELSEIVEKRYYVLLLTEDLHYSSFSHFFNNLSNSREKVLELFDSYTYLLKAIHVLNTNKVVYFDITDEKIGYNKKKQPLLKNFSESFCINDDFSVFEKMFTKYNPEIYSLPLETHIITFLKDESREKKSISQANIEEICKDFIVKNQALRGFSPEFIKTFYKSLVLQSLSFSIINQSREKIIEKMIKYSITWDNYSLSALFLPIITKIRENLNTSNAFFDGFSQLLVLNMDPNPEKRLTPLKTIEKFQDLFDNSIDWNPDLIRF